MIDFWEIAGRLMLMDPATRKADLYDPTGIMPIQSGGCILPGYCQSMLLPFEVATFYDQLRFYLSRKYPPGATLLSPVISMFALGETGVMFFNQNFRTLFETVSDYLRRSPALPGRQDTGSDPLFYICLSLLVMDRTFRTSVTGSGNFLGLQPAKAADTTALKTVAADANFARVADSMCLDGAWKPGSISVLMNQTYGITPTAASTGVSDPGAPAAIRFQHVRFV